MEKVARMSDMNDKAKSQKDMAALITGLMSNVQLEAANRGQENLYLVYSRYCFILYIYIFFSGSYAFMII